MGLSMVRIDTDKGEDMPENVKQLTDSSRKLPPEGSLVHYDEEIEQANEKALNLVEVSPNADPPVCKFLDVGKHRYEAQKKANLARKTQKTQDIKEVKMRPNIDTQDYDVKMRNVVKFFENGDKVKCTLRFRGRENAHKEFGFDAVNRFLDVLNPYGKADTKPRLVGRGISVLIQPLPKRQRAENPHDKSKGELPPMEEEPHEEDGDELEAEGDLHHAFEDLEVPEEKKSA